MYRDFIPKRIAALRIQKGVSACDMSLTLGQNLNYINYIENRKGLPSMDAFLSICDYFQITPQAFFNEQQENPAFVQKLLNELSLLSENERKHIHQIIKDITRNKKT